MALLAIFCCLSFQSHAQPGSQEAAVIKPIWIKAEVIGILEQHDKLAVLQVSRVDSANEFNLATKSEILVEFVFGTSPSDGEPKIPGVKAGDTIRAEIHGKFNPGSGQWDYRVFRYAQLRRQDAGEE